MLAISPTSSIVKPSSAALRAMRSMSPRRDLDCLRPRSGIGEGVLEATNPLPIDRRYTGMEPRCFRRGRVDLGFKLDLVLLKLVQLCLKPWGAEAVGYRLDQTIELAPDRLKFAAL
jgi:hypothetical protein